MPSLDNFANKYETCGEKLIAAMTYSKLNDKYYGQWLVMNKPFRTLEEFTEKAPEIMEKVPARYRYFALAMHHAPDFWLRDESIRAEMELEANSTSHIETILNKVHAQYSLVSKYLSGELAVDYVRSAEEQSGDEAGRPKVKLTNSQKKLREKIKAIMENAMQAHEARASSLGFLLEKRSSCSGKFAHEMFLLMM